MGFAEGVLSASLLGTSSSITPEINQDNGSDLTLTILPGDYDVRYLWFLDGTLVADDPVAYEPVQVAPGGVTIIGGDGGMFGVLDELGIYSRLTDEGSGVDVEVFARAMERLYGSDLVFAEGFDGETLPKSITFSGKENTYTIDGGSLFLPAGTGIELSSIPGDFESLVVEVALAQPDEETGESGGKEQLSRASLVLKDSSEGGNLFELTAGPDSEDSGVLSLAVVPTENGTTVVHGEDTYSVGAIDGGIKLFIENPGENKELEIKSVLVFKDRVQSTAEATQ